jgi:FlaA1/EpsC-like NDP-sugar epimerase
LRPGEKLYEELLVDGTQTATKHPKIFRAVDSGMEWNALFNYINEIQKAIERDDTEIILNILSKLVDGYVPFSRKNSA